MGLLKFPGNDVKNTNKPFGRFICRIIEKSIKLCDGIVNGRDIRIFEDILSEIISEDDFPHYNSEESYFEKLQLLQEKRREIEDNWHIKLISDGWISYKVRNYQDIVLTRWELEEIWERYTQLKIPELSKKYI